MSRFNSYDNEDNIFHIGGKMIFTVFAIILGVIVVCSSFRIIPTGYTGVRITFGQISNEVVPNGFNLKVPFIQSIEKVNNKQQDITFEDVISAETEERNEVFFSGVTVTYQINAAKSAWIYANVADYRKNLVSESLVGSALKTASKTLTPVDVTSRNILEPLVKQCIQDSLDEKYGEEVVKINKVVINNATFDEEYNAKIAQKQQAQMSYETQQIENKTAVEKAEADAKVKITQTQATADSLKISTQAEADALRISAEAESDANKLREQSLTPNVLKNAMIEKWDGKLPRVQGDAETMLSIDDISSLE